MASSKIPRLPNRKLVAKVVTKIDKPCVFCERTVDDEISYGKIYAIGNENCHYFCVLLSSCLIQKGKDEDGLFGFLYPDILAEVERSKKHKCSYCGKGGATLGCCISQCRKQFHLPCGREKNAISLFYGNYKSYCQQHIPKQKVPDGIMEKVTIRKRRFKNLGKNKISNTTDNNILIPNKAEVEQQEDIVCVICYEEVDGFPAPNTFWPPCCARDAWFHRRCVERMALSAGMHYLKCPLCNDKKNFYEAVVSQGYYVPDRDAAWELEQNAFSEIYERPLVCMEEVCKCPRGREYDAEHGVWDIRLCVCCGAGGAHVACGGARAACADCRPLVPEHVIHTLSTVALEQTTETRTVRHGPVMTSRMSLRRTKQRIAYNSPSTSTNDAKNDVTNTREESDLKSPPKRTDENSADENIESSVLSPIENTLLPPIKMEEELKEKVPVLKNDFVFDAKKVIAKMRQEFRKPKSLSEKKKVVDGILQEIISNNNISPKEKEPVKLWNSPKKTARKVNCFENVEYNPTSNEMVNSIKEEDVKDERQVTNDVLDEDDSSSSTFQLPAEFIADYNSDDSLQFETPKTLKTVEIRDNSTMEISKDNHVVNVDVLKIENQSEIQINLKPTPVEKCCLKFSSTDKEILQNDNIGIDLESFKSRYLTEVGNHKCKMNNFTDETNEGDLNQHEHFAVAAEESEDDKKILKRKLKTEESFSKKHKGTKDQVVVKYQKEDADIEVVCSDKTNNHVIDLTVESIEKKGKKRLKKLKKSKKGHKKMSFGHKKIKLKIKWKNEEVKLRISKSKRKKNKDQCKMKTDLKFRKHEIGIKKGSSKLKQYVLQCSPDSSINLITKPEKDVSVIKRKYVKNEILPDNLKQTSLYNFFKTKT